MTAKFASKANIILLSIFAVLFAVAKIFDSIFEITAGVLLVFLFLAFIGLWIYVLSQKKIFLSVWIPTIVLFLMGRPMAFLVQGEQWTYFGKGVSFIYLLILFFTLCGIGLAMLPEKRPLPCPALPDKIRRPIGKVWKWIRAHSFNKEELRENRFFRVFIALGYAITFGSYFITKIAEYVNMRGKTYLDFYLGDYIALPWIITFLASLGIYFACVQLALVTKKRWVIVIVGLYFLSTIPTLLIGQRNPFILALIFGAAVLYLKNKECWHIKVSKKTMIALVCAAVVLVLVLVLMMSVFAGSRNEQDTGGLNIFDRVLTFIEDQGFTYEMIGQTITNQDYLRKADNNCYTFAPIVDYYVYGEVGNLLLGTAPIPMGNNAARAHQTNDLAHKISYRALGENYLNGAGLGTSYVMETYIDFGLIGVLLINLFYGFLLIRIGDWFGKELLADTAIIHLLLKVFFIGRDGAIIPFYSLFTLHFIMVVAGMLALVILSKLLKKGKNINEK